MLWRAHIKEVKAGFSDWWTVSSLVTIRWDGAQESLDSLTCKEMDERANDWISPWPEMFLSYVSFHKHSFCQKQDSDLTYQVWSLLCSSVCRVCCVPLQMYILKECIQIAYYRSLTKLSCQKLCFNSRLASCSV